MKKLIILLHVFSCLFLLFYEPSIQASELDLTPNHHLFINEIMSSNETAFKDQYGKYSDWIEIYNPNSFSVNMSGYFISDRYDNLKKYRIPNQTVIGANGFLLLIASGEDIVYKNQIHLNFSINQLGEPIILSDSEGQIIDYVGPVSIPKDFSYGRFPDGSSLWAYFNRMEVTPKISNNSATPQRIESEFNPSFSHEGGFYNEDFLLSITPQHAMTVYYTLDGSEPTKDKQRYTHPILIEKQYIEATQDEVRIQNAENLIDIPVPSFPLSMIRTGSQNWISPKEDIYKATVIKVRAYDDEDNQSEIITHTYFVDEMAHQKYTFPVMSISTETNHLFSYETGINVPGVNYDYTLPETGNSNRTGNYFMRGDDWERPVYVEMFNAMGEKVISQHAGIRIHGGLSRKYPIKSYRLYARDTYDINDYFNYAFFDDKEIDRYKRIVLRGGGQAYQYTFMGEAAAQSLLQPLSIDYQSYQPVILFINGEYFGIRNIRDRFDTFYLSTHYGGSRDNFTVLTGHAYPDTGSIDGQRHYRDLYNIIVRNNMKENYYYNHVQTMMDIDNFTDYYISQIYFGNVDWPQNNISYWRYNVDYKEDLPYGLDGRWRWMVYDVDAGFGASWGGYLPDINTFTRLIGDEWRTGILLANLLDNPSFRKQYINRFADLLNTIFHTDHSTKTVDYFRALYEPEMREHIARWGYPSSMGMWHNYVNRMKTFAEKRSENIFQQMIEHYQLGTLRNVKIESDQQYGYVKLNSLHLRDGYYHVEQANSWEGQYFQNVPIDLEAMPNKGYRLKGWYDALGQLVSISPKVTLDLKTDLHIQAVFEEGEPFPIEDDTPYIDESIILYISVFIISTIAIVTFFIEIHRRNQKTSDRSTKKKKNMV